MRRIAGQCASLLIFSMMVLLQSCGQAQQSQQIDTVPKTKDEEPASTPGGHSVAEKETASFRLVMLGDSITAGFGLPSDQALPVKLEEALIAQGYQISIINAGVSGDTTGDALNRFDWSVGPDTDGLIIALGGNDLLQGIEPETTRANLEEMLQRANARNLPVLLAGMKAPGNYGADYQRLFDEIYPNLAKQYKAALYPFFLEGVATRTDLNQPDRIHPNVDGVAILVEKLSPFIVTTFPLEMKKN